MRRLIALTAVFACAPALAQEGLGGYVGIGISQIDYEDNVLLRFDVGDSAISPKLVAGYRFNDTLAFEANYSPGADFSSRDTYYNISVFSDGNGGFGAGTVDATYTGEVDFFELRVLAHTEVMVFGLSYFTSDYKARLAGTSTLYPEGFDGRVSDSDDGYSIIIGAQWDLGKFGIRPEFEYFDVSSPADAYSVGVQLTYGF